jgi:hypothetical protein
MNHVRRWNGTELTKEQLHTTVGGILTGAFVAASHNPMFWKEINAEGDQSFV